MPFENPLDEDKVFSDPEEENEYFWRIYNAIPKTVLPAKNRDVEVQCDVEEFIELKEILKLLSCCRFENATNGELAEFLTVAKWVSLKYSVQNNEQPQTTSKSLESEKESGIESMCQSDSTSYSKNKTTLSRGSKKSLNKIKPDTTEKRPRRSQRRKIDETKGICDNDSENLAEANTELNTNIDEERNQHAEMRLDMENCKENAQSTFSNNSVYNTRHSNKTKAMPLSKKKKLLASKNKSDKIVSEEEHDKPKKTQSQPSNIQPDSEIFKKPMEQKKSLRRNWFKPNNSFSCPIDDNQNAKPHFASFQSHLKTRRLHSPQSWLSSEEFAQNSLENTVD